MADATMPVATTSRIIPPIMNELLIFTLHSAWTPRCPAAPFPSIPDASMQANGYGWQRLA